MDKLITYGNVLLYAWVIFALSRGFIEVLDSEHWRFVLGFILISLGYAFAACALADNRIFSSVVRIQTDRGHVVCGSGPYRFVRHSGYAGNLPPLIGIVLALSSVWTLIPAAVALIVTVRRTELDDQTLQEELSGYRDYARRVRYRLIPGIY